MARKSWLGQKDDLSDIVPPQMGASRARPQAAPWEVTQPVIPPAMATPAPQPSRPDPAARSAALLNQIRAKRQQYEAKPQGYNSGGTSEATQADTNTGGAQSQVALYMSPEEFQAAEKNLTESPQIKAQIDGIERLKELTRTGLEGAPVQRDLSSLKDFVKTFSNGRYDGEGYKAPVSQEARQASLLANMQKLQDDSRDVSKTILDGIAKQRAGQIMDFSKFDLRNGQKQQYVDPKKNEHAPRGGRGSGDDIKWRDKIFQNIKNDKEIIKASDQMHGVDMARQLLASGKSVGDEAFKTAFRRAMGDDRISNVDIANTNGDKAAADRLFQMFGTVTEGKFIEENRKQYLQVLDDLAGVAAGRRKQSLDRHATQASITYRMSEKDARDLVYKGREYMTKDSPQADTVINKLYHGGAGTQPAAPGAPPASAPAGMSPEKLKRLEELRQKKAAAGAKK